MTQQLDLESWVPPRAPVEMPYQVLERQHETDRSWLALMRQLVVRQAPHE